VAATGAVGASISITVAGSNTVLVACGAINFPDATVSSLTYGGQALTQHHRESNPTAVVVEMWRKIAPLAGANLLEIEISDSTNLVLGGVNFTGAHQTTPLGTVTASQATGADPVTDDVTGAADGLVVDCLGLSGVVTPPDVGSAQTSRFANQDEGDFFGASSTQGGGGTVTMSWDDTGSCCVHAHVAALVSASAVAATPRLQRRIMIQ
jgi:hypothetical protein